MPEKFRFARVWLRLFYLLWRVSLSNHVGFEMSNRVIAYREMSRSRVIFEWIIDLFGDYMRAKLHFSSNLYEPFFIINLPIQSISRINSHCYLKLLYLCLVNSYNLNITIDEFKRP
jgi:hypothetical protein